MIRALFFDIDGTLVSHTSSDIPADTLDALYRLRGKGILLFLATGRHLCEFSQLPLHGFPFDGYVTQTGQLCYDGDFRPICEDPLDAADTAQLAACFERRLLPIVLISRDRLYINFVNETVRSTQASIHTAVPALGRYRGEPLFGATVFGSPGEIRELVSRLPHCRESSWHEHASDIVALDSGKVSGIRRILERFGLDREEIAAFGDEDNDLDMIRFAGVGVAMGNATARVREAADLVTSSVDDRGISRALERLGLLL